MASQLYAVYSVLVNPTTGAVSSLLNLYTDEYGTPAETGTLVRSYTGGGPNLLASLVDGTYKPNLTEWSEEMTDTGGGDPVTVNVTGAGTAAALVTFTLDGRLRCFPASVFVLARSAPYPDLYTFNADGEPAAESASGYSSAITAATALSAVAVEVSGRLDTGAESHVLRYRTGSSGAWTEIPLAGTDSEVFPVRIYGLAPETAYTLEIVSAGPRGTSVSEPATVTTGAPAALAAPSFQVLAAESGGVKRVVIADLAGASSFEIETAAGGVWSGNTERVLVSNRSGAEVFLRQWPESEGTAYAVRVRALAGSAAFTDSPWSEPQNVTVEAESGGGDDAAESDAALTVYANIAIEAEPNAPNHVVTLSKASALISDAVAGIGTTVSSVAGYTGAVTIAQILAKAQTDRQLIVHSSAAAPNTGNQSVITSSATDNQLATARAVYYYVQNTRTSLNALISGHNHSYLYGADGASILAAPELEEDATIVPETVIAGLFDPSVTYQAGAVVTDAGYLYRNTSGGTSAGNRDFARKWEKVTVAELVALAAAASGGARYETEFYGADLDENYSIEIAHQLGVQFVSVEVIDITSGSGNPVTAAQVNLTSSSVCRLTFSAALPNNRRMKVVVRG